MEQGGRVEEALTQGRLEVDRQAKLLRIEHPQNFPLLVTRFRSTFEWNWLQFLQDLDFDFSFHGNQPEEPSECCTCGVSARKHEIQCGVSEELTGFRYRPFTFKLIIHVVCWHILPFLRVNLPYMTCRFDSLLSPCWDKLVYEMIKSLPGLSQFLLLANLEPL